MAERVPIKDLFFYSRIQGGECSKLALCLYTPIGLCLLVFRLFLGLNAFVASWLIPKTSPLRRVVLRTLCTLLGVVVKEEGYQDRKAKVLISTHVSPLDFSAVDVVRPCSLVNVWKLPELLRWCLGYVELGASEGGATLVRRASDYATESSVPLLVFPEGALSRPPLLGLAPSVVGSRWWSDLLCFLFVPYSLFRLRWLPTQRKGPDEDSAAFAARVQRMCAEEAGLEATDYGSREAVDHAKRWLKDQAASAAREKAAARRRPAQPPSPARLDAMALRLKETFPDASLAAIRADLETSGSAETTASHILEGALAAAQKSDSPVARLAARKWALIEENRAAYLRRHGLTV